MYEPFWYPKTGLLTRRLEVPGDITTTVWSDESHRLNFDQKYMRLLTLEVPADHDRGTDCRDVRILPALVAGLVQSAPTLFYQKTMTKKKKKSCKPNGKRLAVITNKFVRLQHKNPTLGFSGDVGEWNDSAGHGNRRASVF